MLFNVAVYHGGPHLLIVASGRAHLCDCFGLFDLTARVAQMKGYKRVMVDLLAVEPALSVNEHLQLGAHVASVLAGLDRVATVVDARFKTGTSERAAQKHGLNLRTFVDIHEATEWLAT
jgi:hypothetical protein